jgi:glucosamine-6-phosphate deaminase
MRQSEVVETLVLASPAEVASRAADTVCELLAARPAAVLALPAGRTPGPLYQELVRRHREEGLSFAGAIAFDLDEYLGIGAEHPASFRRYLDEQLYRLVDISPTRIHSPDGRAEDPAAEAARYDRAIAAAGGVDLVILGLGGNGHLAFNEPGSLFDAPTRVVALAAETRDANRAAFPGEAVPDRAITVGMSTILGARRCLLLASGAAKGEAIVRLVEGPISPAFPASALRAHPNALVLVDEAAGCRLTRPRR